MRLVICVLLALFFACQMAIAQETDVWAEEEWVHVEKTLDCDGVPLIVDTDIRIPMQNEACTYELGKISIAERQAWLEKIDWNRIGFENIARLEWRAYDTMLNARDLENQYLCVFSEYHMYLADERFLGIFENYDSPVPEHGVIYETESFDGFDFDDVCSYAEKVAEEFGLQIGKANRVYRLTKEQINSDNIMLMDAAEYFTENNQEIQAYAAWFPVYYQEKRFNSYRYGMTTDMSNAKQCSLKIVYTVDGPKALFVPLIDRLDANGKTEKIMSYDEAIENVRRHYAETFLPGVDKMQLSELVMEYIPYCAKPPYERYTVYPVWRAKIVIEHSDGAWEMMNIAFHADTGKVLYSVK